MKDHPLFNVLHKDQEDRLYELYHENSKMNRLETDTQNTDQIQDFLSIKPTSLALPYKSIYRFQASASSEIKLDDNSLLSANLLGDILKKTYGVSDSQGNINKRKLDSIGDIYPLELFIVTIGITDLENALYHYGVNLHQLELLKSLKNYENIENQFIDLQLEEPGVIIYVTCIMQDIARFHGEKSYRYMLLESGKVLQNIFTSCNEKGLKYHEIYKFRDYKVEEFLGIDGLNHIVSAITKIS